MLKTFYLTSLIIIKSSSQLRTSTRVLSTSIMSSAVPNSIDESRTRKLAVFFGDSITQGGWIVDPKMGRSGFVTSLAHWWSRKVDILNRGFNGYNTDYALEVFPDAVLKLNPDIVFIFFGANDASLAGEPQHVPLDRYRSNLEKMIKSLKDKHIQVVLLTPTPIWEKKIEIANKKYNRTTLLDRTNDNNQLYVNVIKELASQYHLHCIDAFTGLHGHTDKRKDYLYDGLHLNFDGNKALYELIIHDIKHHLPEYHPDTIPLPEPYWKDFIQNNYTI